MMNPQDILDALSRMVVATPLVDGVRVSTHCLFPSNGSVSVVVRGGEREFVVSDDGAALDELSSAGLTLSDAERFLRRLVKIRGLRVGYGAIYSPPVPIDGISAAIMLVANASKECAEWGLANLKHPVQRNFRADLDSLLNQHFNDQLKIGEHILGASNKSHKFNYVVHLKGERRLLIDPVVNDASSINARVVANLDVQRIGNPLLEQIIVYDNRIDWKSSDLKLLEVGARTVPFSYAESEIMKLAA